MDTIGARQSGLRFAPNDHRCWVYDDSAPMLNAAREFLADGLARGHRIGYIGGVGLAEMEDDVARMVQAVGRSGAGFVAGLSEMYRSGDVISPADQVEVCTQATAQALRDGFTGLRVAADVTDLVRSPTQRDAFARYEHLIDRRIPDVAFSAMCAYDRSSLGSAATAELACMHASSNRQLCSFSLVAGTGGTIALRGEIDAVDRESFVTALSRIAPPDDGDELVIDATDLEFIDHNGLLAMTDVISRSGRRAVMRTRSSGPARLAEIMGLTRVLRVEVGL